MDKKFYIYANDMEKSKALKALISQQLKKQGCSISNDAKNIIVLGGDGTFVHAYNRYAKKDVKIALINTGFVGFYSIDIEPTAKNIIEFFNNDKNFYIPDVVECKTGNKSFYALNEIVVVASNTVSMDCYINDRFYEKFWGSGLCFATKTGSTGYNKSLNGSILLTQNRLWQMTEMAPLAHAKYMSIRNSIVLDEKKTMTLKSLRTSGDLNLVADGIENKVKVTGPFKLGLTTLKAKIGFYKGLQSYLDKIQEVFIGEKQ